MNQANQAHPHAALMMEYAKDAMETDKPWERWEFKRQESWHSPKTNLAWDVNTQYRRKRKTVVINGREVTAPMTEAPKADSGYWYVSFRHDDWCAYFEWCDDNTDIMLLERGLCFESAADAAAYAKALIDWKDDD